MIWPHEFALYTCYIASMMSKDIKQKLFITLHVKFYIKLQVVHEKITINDGAIDAIYRGDLDGAR